MLLGGLGFWYPMWYDRRLNNPDSRLGIVLVWTLPVITVFAVRATQALRATMPDRTFQAWLRSPLLSLLLVICWFPVAYVAFNMLGLGITLLIGIATRI
jgi:hypothetical protein